MELHYPKKANGMFILGKYDMDDIAYMVLREYMPSALESPETVDIIKLAEGAFYLTIRNEILQKPVLAITAFDDIEDIADIANVFHSSVIQSLPTGTVLVDARLKSPENRRRRRYTIAHEVAHWILHRTYFSPTNQKYHFREQRAPYIACRVFDIEHIQRYINSDKGWVEWQANSLASALLMPREPFRTYSENLIHSMGWRYLCESRITSDYDFILDAIAGYFMVSRIAAEIRLKQLGLMQEQKSRVNLYGYIRYMTG